MIAIDNSGSHWLAYGSARAHAMAGHKELATERFQALTSIWKGQPFANPVTDAR